MMLLDIDFVNSTIQHEDNLKKCCQGIGNIYIILLTTMKTRLIILGSEMDPKNGYGCR